MSHLNNVAVLTISWINIVTYLHVAYHPVGMIHDISTTYNIMKIDNELNLLMLHVKSSSYQIDNHTDRIYKHETNFILTITCLNNITSYLIENLDLCVYTFR